MTAGVVSTSTDSANRESAAAMKRGEKRRMIFNVIALSIAFMVHFTAFSGISNLQSSINAGLGQTALATIYGSLIFSNVFLPVVMIKFLGCKWAVAISFIAYMPYIAAQYHPEAYTLIPAALAVGLGGGPLWCGKCTYLTVIAEAYSSVTKIPSDVLVVRFFGLFFMVLQCSQIWGNLIASTVLSTGESNDLKPPNLTIITSVCGAKFCPGYANDETLLPPSEDKVKIIAAIYLGCMVCAVAIVAIFVDSLSRYDNGRKGSGSGIGGLRLLAITLKLLKDFKQILLLPITIWLGMTQAFLSADYTAAFITCSWGVRNVGYVMICYGVVNSFSAITTGWIVKFTGRQAVVCLAGLLHFGIIIFLLNWVPNGTEDERYKFFLITGLWGFADGVWLVQINAYCGILFPGKEEAAYSNFRLWESLGFIVAYSYSAHLCIIVKLYLLLGVMLVGVTGYLIVENVGPRRRLRNRKSAEQT